MANAGSLYVSIFARTSGFQKGLRRARKDIGDFAAGAAKSAGIAAAALGTGAGLMIRDTMKDMVDTGRLSERLNLPTEDLVAMREAAQDAGVDFNQLKTGLQKFAVVSGKMGAGGSTAENFFKVSDAITSLGSSQQRAALAQEAFGRSGVELLNFLTGARQKIADARAENDKLGLSFGLIDWKKVEAGSIALGNMRDVLTGIATQAMPTISGFIIALSENFVDLSKTGRGAFGVISDSIGGVTGSVAKLMDWTEGIKFAFHSMVGVIQAGLGGVAKVVGFFISDSLEAVGEGLLGDAGKSKGLAESAFAKFMDGSNQKKAAAWIDGMEKRAGELAVDLTKAGNVVNTIGDLDGVRKQFKDQTKLDFQQGDISKMAIGFAGRRVNKNPQIDTTNKLLQQILNKSGGKSVAVAG